VCEHDEIYNLGAVGDKEVLITFWGQKVKGQGHSENKCTVLVETYQSTVCHGPPPSCYVCYAQHRKTDLSAWNMSLFTGVWSHSDWSSESPVCKSLCLFGFCHLLSMCSAAL